MATRSRSAIRFRSPRPRPERIACRRPAQDPPGRRLTRITFCVRGVVSPLLSNLVLDALDRELERRGHRFVRYADDCNIYVRSQRAGQRVMASLTRFITSTLKLTVNSAKSAGAPPGARTFLGFSFTRPPAPRRRLAPSTMPRFKVKVRDLTRRTRGVSLETMVQQLGTYLRGWRGYFGFCQTPSALTHLDEGTRRRLRSAVWKPWKHGRTRFRELRRRGVGLALAATTAGSAHGPWRLSHSPALTGALPKAFFATLGLPELTGPVASSTRRTAVYGPVRTVG